MDLALRTVHLLAAIVWTGGTVALVFVAVPPVQRLQGPERAELLRELGRRWRPIGWSALGIAAVTGVALAQRAHAFHGAPHDFDWVLGVKAVLVGLLIGGRVPARLRARSGSRAPGARRTAAVAPAAPRRHRPHEPRAHDRAPDPRCRARAAAGRLTAFRGRRHGAVSLRGRHVVDHRPPRRQARRRRRARDLRAPPPPARAARSRPRVRPAPGGRNARLGGDGVVRAGAGVRVELLVDGADALPRMAEEIAAAKRHVELAGWFFSPDFRMGTGGPDAARVARRCGRARRRARARVGGRAAAALPSRPPRGTRRCATSSSPGRESRWRSTRRSARCTATTRSS